MPFDADAFMNAQTSGPMSTQIVPCPEGEYTAKVDDGDNFITFREVNTKNGPRPIARILFEVLDEGVRAKLNRPKVTVPYDIWLDTTASGGIDTSEGMNVRLGQLRAALGQNSDAPWGFGMLKGAGPLAIRTSVRTDDSDKYQSLPPSERPKYAEVVRTAPIR
jgi:hypothetical protein